MLTGWRCSPDIVSPKPSETGMHGARHTHLTIHTEYHTDRSIANRVPSHTLIAACVRRANIVDGQESFGADVKFSTFCYLNTILKENNKNDIAVILGNRSFFSVRIECPFTVKTQMGKKNLWGYVYICPNLPREGDLFFSHAQLQEISSSTHLSFAENRAMCKNSTPLYWQLLW